jgi:hypothetical protein
VKLPNGKSSNCYMVDHDVSEAVRQMILADGVMATAHALGIGREVALCVAARIPVRRPYLLFVTERVRARVALEAAE